MPDLGGELHDRWLEWILIRNVNGDFICAALIWCSRGALKRASEVCDTVPDGVCKDLGSRVCSNISQVFGYPSCFVPGHFVVKRGK